MIQVHLVGYTADLQHLVLDVEVDATRGRYRLPVDLDLFLTLDEVRELRRQSGMEAGPELIPVDAVARLVADRQPASAPTGEVSHVRLIEGRPPSPPAPDDDLLWGRADDPQGDGELDSAAAVTELTPYDEPGGFEPAWEEWQDDEDPAPDAAGFAVQDDGHVQLHDPTEQEQFEGPLVAEDELCERAGPELGHEDELWELEDAQDTDEDHELEAEEPRSEESEPDEPELEPEEPEDVELEDVEQDHPELRDDEPEPAPEATAPEEPGDPDVEDAVDEPQPAPTHRGNGPRPAPKGLTTATPRVDEAHRRSANGEGSGSSLSPAQIQSLLRAGRSPKSVAQAAGTSVGWVERWLPPILAERDQVLREAREHRLERSRLGRSSKPLGAAITTTLQQRNVDPDAVTWSVSRRADGRWSINVRYRHRGRSRSATWAFDRDAGTLSAASSLARDLGWTAKGTRSRAKNSRRRSR